MSDFLSFCRDHGIIIDTLPVYGRWVRCPTLDHPRKRNGAVKWLETHGFVQNHALMSEPALWQPDKTEKPISLVELRRKQEKAREHARAEQQAQIQAIAAMRKYWNSLPMLRGNHPYLEKKGLSNRGCSNLRIDGDKLAIPMFKRGQLMSVQTIAPDGSKKFRFRCPVKETTYELKRSRSMFTCLCEGFATGLTLYQSIPTASVVVCFNSSNLVDVAKTRTTAGMTVICADNDHKTTGNPGITKGKEAAEILRCGLAYPEGISGTDWDDARQEWGEGAYARIRAEVMRSAKMVT